MTKPAMTTQRMALAGFALAAILLAVLGSFPLWKVVAAVAICYGMFRIGIGVIGSFARPVPPPPPAGELRKVRLQFRCSLCGTEVRMTSANDEIPEPPRHCMEDMELVAPALE